MSKQEPLGRPVYAPAPYVTDILAPPQWQGPPGQLLAWNVTVSENPKYSILGTDSQVAQFVLAPGETVVSEPGAMVYKADTIKMNTGVGGCCNGFKRCCGGESFFRNTYTNKGEVPAGIAISPPFPAKIIPVDLSRSGPITVNPGLYVAHLGDVNVTFHFVSNVLAGCCGGGGFLLQKITGTGTVFLSGGGTVLEKILAPGENLLIDTASMVAFASTAQYSVGTTGGCLACCCGGEGLFNTKITGPGLVITQSMSLDRMRAALYVPRNNGGGAAGEAAQG